MSSLSNRFNTNDFSFDANEELQNKKSLFPASLLRGAYRESIEDKLMAAQNYFDTEMKIKVRNIRDQERREKAKKDREMKLELAVRKKDNEQKKLNEQKLQNSIYNFDPSIKGLKKDKKDMFEDLIEKAKNEAKTLMEQAISNIVPIKPEPKDFF